DQAGSSLPSQRKHRQEIGLVEIDVELTVDRRASRLDIGDIEDLPIRTSREACADRVAHNRVGPITAGDVARLAGFLPAIWAAQAGNDPLALLREAGQFGLALDRNPERLQPLDQQPLMLVLREDMQERIRRQVGADTLK